MATELFELYREGNPTGQFRQMTAQQARAENIKLLFCSRDVWQLWEPVEAMAVKAELNRVLEAIRAGAK